VKIERKPEWLRKINSREDQAGMRKLLGELRLNTVCQEALCPNISECYSCGQATFLILGKSCTRLCSFCNVEKTIPFPIDSDEPARVAEAVKRLNLNHVVITSPTRDDLPDGGAGLYAATVGAIRTASPETRIELLIPDFNADYASLKVVTSSNPNILGHNLETVPRLYQIRRGSDYQRSLEVIKICAQLAPDIRTKSGLMLGMGEKEEEVLQVFADLRKAACSYLSLGQYLAPSRAHYPVREYIRPEMFDEYRKAALELGFNHVESGPYVRSSYHAGQYA